MKIKWFLVICLIGCSLGLQAQEEIPVVSLNLDQAGFEEFAKTIEEQDRDQTVLP